MIETEPCGRFTYHRLRSEVLRTLADELGRLAASAEDAAGSKRPC